MYKLIIMTPIKSAARIPYYEELGRYVDLTIVAERETPTEILNKFGREVGINYKSIVLKSIKMFKYMGLSFGIFKYLKKNKYDLIIVEQYASPTAVLAILYMKLFKREYAMNADGGFVKNEKTLKEKLKKFLIKGAKFYLTSGKIGEKYLDSYCAISNDIEIFPFASLSIKEQPDKLLTLEEKKSLKEKKIGSSDYTFLFVGQFIYRKGIDLILEIISEASIDANFVLIGGKLSEKFEKFIELKDLPNVNVFDFMAKVELLEYYAMADCVLIPTREDIWNFSVIEAYSCGSRVITTTNCGAGIEVLQPESELLIDPDNKTALVNAMKYSMNNPITEKESKKYFELSKKYTSESMGKAIFEIADRRIR